MENALVTKPRAGKRRAGLIDVAMSEPCVQRFVSRYKLGARHTPTSAFRGFLVWFWTKQREQKNAQGVKNPTYNSRIPKGLLEAQMPSELLAFQEQAKGAAAYAILDLVQDYVQEKGGTYMGMRSRFSGIRMFWAKNRIPLPDASDWHPTPTREPVKGQLTVQKVHEVITHAKLRDQAIFLTMFQSLMDLERFRQFNSKYAGPLVQRLVQAQHDPAVWNEPFRIDYALGRKGNMKEFYTFIHFDSLKAWEAYFNRIRGWPKSGEPIALTQYNQAMSKAATRKAFNTIASQLRFRPKDGSTGDLRTRTGVSPHEAFRDVVRTMLRTKAKAEGFDLAVSEFWMGHTVDPLQYDKFAQLEPDYVTQHAKIASKHLNIISNQTSSSNPEQEQLLREIQEELKQLKEWKQQQDAK